MGATMGRSPDPLTFFRAAEEKPYAYDFFQTLRRIECLHPAKPRLGRALKPVDEPVRLAQEPSLAFAPATLTALRLRDGGRPPRLEVAFFGLLGPNGPLPLHLTEFARDRLLHHDDPTFARFLDVFNHRFLALFYRAWAQAQPAVNLDRPHEDRFATYVGALIGLGSPRMRHRDVVPDAAKLFYSGLLARQARNADGLAALLQGFFRVPVQIEEFVGHWMPLAETEQTRVGGSNATLGQGAVLGKRVWDRQHKVRVCLGPLTLAQYEAFLPGGEAMSRLVAWVRNYLHFELEWDARLILRRDQVPATRIGRHGRLGWSTWLGRYWRGHDAGDLTLDAERLARRQQRTTTVPSAAAA
jgi:type VI secretion system protein ImpH